MLDAFVELLARCTCGDGIVSGLDGLVRRSLRIRGWLDGIDTRITVQAPAELADQG